MQKNYLSVEIFVCARLFTIHGDGTILLLNNSICEHVVLDQVYSTN